MCVGAAVEIAQAQREFAAAVGTPLLAPSCGPPPSALLTGDPPELNLGGGNGGGMGGGGVSSPLVAPGVRLTGIGGALRSPLQQVAEQLESGRAHAGSSSIGGGGGGGGGGDGGGAGSPAAPRAPTCAADFRLLAVIGRGAYGKVLQVAHAATGRVYAMKCLDKATLVAGCAGGDGTARPGRSLLDYTRVERDVMTRLQHPYLVSLRYAFQTRDKVRAWLWGGGRYLAPRPRSPHRQR
jgi:hypothetical protein